jgi:NTE family protein
MRYSSFRIFLILVIAISQILGQKEANCVAAETIEVNGAVPKVGSAAGDCPKHRKVALVLGGGGCKAAAQIGVLKVFEANQIPIDYIVGTSAGAIIGGLYAAGVPSKEIEQMFLDGSLQRAMAPHMLPRIIVIGLTKIFYLGRKKPYAGITNGSKLEKFMRRRMSGEFNSLKIPFAAVATDLETGRTCMLNEGDVCKAIVASSAVPPFVRPVTIGNTIYIDGGLRANLPTNCAQLTGAGIIIAVPADAPIVDMEKRKFTSLRKLTERVIDIMESELDSRRWQQANIVISPDVAGTPGITKDAKIIHQTITNGERAASAALPQIRLLLSQGSH